MTTACGSGKPDVVLILGHNLAVFDYKCGRVAVDPSESNMQLRDLAVMSRFGTTESVTVAALQPWVTQTPALCRYGKDDLDRAQEEMWQRIMACHACNAPRVPGLVQCKYCRACATDRCPETQRSVALVAPPDLSISSPARVSQLLSACKIAERAIKAVREQATDMIQRGLEVPGWSLKPGAVRRKITNVQKVFSRMQGFGVTADEFAAKAGITFESIEELLRNAASIKGEELKEKVTEIVKDAVEEKPTAPSLVESKDND